VSELEAGLDDAGDATVVWTEGQGINSALDAAARPAATAVWSPPGAISTPGGFNNSSRLAVDPDGDAFVVWPFIAGVGSGRPIRFAAYDAAGPALRSLSIPGAGTAGEPVAFSVAPLDAISAVVATTWSFGDGGSAGTAAATHAYGSPGTYAVTVTAVDAAGNTSSASGQVTVSAAATVKSSPPPPGPTPPRTLRVKVSCPKSARSDGCRFAVQAVDAKPRRAKGKGGKTHLVASKPESAVARIKLAAGRSALLTLVPKAKYAAKLAAAAKVLVRESKTVGGGTETDYRLLKLLR
jgi:PKD domain